MDLFRIDEEHLIWGLKLFYRTFIWDTLIIAVGLFICSLSSSQFRKRFSLLHFHSVPHIFNLYTRRSDTAFLNIWLHFTQKCLSVYGGVYLSVSQLVFIEGSQSMCVFVNTKFADYLILKNGPCKSWPTNSIMRIILFPKTSSV